MDTGELGGQRLAREVASPESIRDKGAAACYSNSTMKPLNTSIYSFDTLREAGFLYVDKTHLIHGLVERPGQYFLSRPRRFGKSLLLSTFKAIFQGRRDLFAGLAIDSLPFEWKSHPVIHIDLGTKQAQSSSELERKLCEVVDDNAQANGVTLSRVGSSSRFEELVRFD